MVSTPRVSVYMAVCNGLAYLPEAIESVLAQTYTDFEFVIVDDGSTDDTPVVLREYGRRDERVRIVTQPNTGHTRALNAALHEARGEFCAKMDADDICEVTRLQHQVAVLEQRREIVALGSGVLLIDPEGLPIRPIIPALTHEEIDRQHLSGHSGAAFAHPTLIARREAMLRVGGYDPSYPVAQDIDLLLRLAEHGKLACLADILVRYRQHASSVGYAKRQVQQEAASRAAIMARQCRGLPPVAPTKAAKAMSPTDCHLRWARWALKAGNIATARKHALTACANAPWSLTAWKLRVQCSIGSQRTGGV